MSDPRCPSCRFCEEANQEMVLCSNADLAEEAGWQALYYQLGYLELPPSEPGDEPCFWYVPR